MTEPRLATLIVSPDAGTRIDCLVDRLVAATSPSDPVVVVATTREAAAEVLRRMTERMSATFGMRPVTLARLAVELGALELARRGLVPAVGLSVEAVAARAVAELAHENRLGRFADVAETPGLARALVRTVSEVREAGVASDQLPPDLAVVVDRFSEALRASGLADRAELMRRATAGVEHDDVVRPETTLVLADVAPSCRAEVELLAALAKRSARTFATTPVADRGARRRLDSIVDWDVETLASGSRDRRLVDLQTHLFAETAPEPPIDVTTESAASDDGVEIFSAPGEAREAVEIVRRIRQIVADGVPFDRVAVLLRASEVYRAPLREAFRRADIPAWFARGTRRPDPVGRAFLALLACREEGYSASRFAEYLSLGEVPRGGAAAVDRPADANSDFVRSDDELFDAPVYVDEFATDATEAGDDAPAPPLFVPRRWERLLVDAAVIGGLDRWRRRLDGLDQEFERQLDSFASEDGDAPRRETIERRREALTNLREFALPVLEMMAAWPHQAKWGEWADRLATLATTALRRPERVSVLLAELEPLAEVGPVGLDEVRRVLERRLTELDDPPPKRRYGRVFVGPIERARGLDFDVVFIPGLAERMFPKKVVEDPVLLDRARRDIDELETDEDRAEAERAALVVAVGAARRRVVFSWSRLDGGQSRVRVPSFYSLEAMRAAEGRLPGFDELARRADRTGAARIGWPAPERPELAIDEAEHDLALLRHATRHPSAEVKGTARYLLGTNPHLARALRSRYARWRLKKLTRFDGLVDPRPGGRAALANHRTTARSFSPTALQQFADCPYKFVLYTIHKLAVREVPAPIEEIDPLTRGSMVHEVLYEFLTEWRDAGHLPLVPRNLAVARTRMDEILDEIAARWADDLVPAIDRVWTDAIESIRADLREWLRRASEEEEWQPSRFELSFGLTHRGGRDDASLDDPVELDCGLVLRGAIDLIEVDAMGRLRATDYKTGKVRFTEGATVEGGRALQPALYALAAEKVFPDKTILSGRLYYCTNAGGFETREVPLDNHTRDAAATIANIIGEYVEEGCLPRRPPRRGLPLLRLQDGLRTARRAPPRSRQERR